jgi:amidase
MAATIAISSGATWQQVSADRQNHRASTLSLLSPPLPTIAEHDLPLNTLPLARKYLTTEELKITETLPEDLVSQLARGELSSVAVTQAFLRRAGLAQLAVRLLPFYRFPSFPSLPSLPTVCLLFVQQ